MTFTSLHLGRIADLVPDHCDKLNIAIKGVTVTFFVTGLMFSPDH